MKRKYRLAQVIFNRFQSSPARTLSKGLKGDLIWESLSRGEHQVIG